MKWWLLLAAGVYWNTGIVTTSVNMFIQRKRIDFWGQKFNSGIGNILKPLDLVLKALKNQVKQPQRNKKKKLYCFKASQDKKFNSDMRKISEPLELQVK